MFGFTQKEQGVILFLSACLIIGLGLQGFQKYWAPLPDTPDEKMSVANAAPIQKPDSTSVFIVAINRADANLLEQLPGVGPVLAKRIFEFREKNGRFQAIEDLMKVKGIGKKTLDRISPFIRCD
jgi:comEA protein